ncbi:MAG: DUF2283 domain-containing protein [SAR202 cluster bacterium]|nr:DUF2283 domain-containing protein [SAR202 cluster bacterium]
MNITYDKAADVLLIQLEQRDAATTRDIAPGVFVDYDEHGKVLAIEFLNAGKKYELDASSIEQPDPYIPLARAAEISGLSAGTLRHQIHRGLLQGKKIGRNWAVHFDELSRYASETSRRSKAIAGRAPEVGMSLVRDSRGPYEARPDAS